MPLKPLALKLHRWIALLFALPLAIVILTGVILAFEPALKARTPEGTITLPRLEAVLAAAGPGAANASLMLRGYDGTVTLGGRGAAARSFDLASAAPAEPGALAGLFLAARGLHERLLFGLGWLVTASTAAMLLLCLLGLLLGLPRLRNTIGGWHKATGWFLLPLVIGSPLTGLILGLGLGAPAPAAAPAGPAPGLLETLRLLAARHDLDGLDFVRSIGPARLARVLDDSGTAIVYRITAAGLEPQPTAWARLLHEGNWGGLLGSGANLVAGLAIAGLLGTGFYLWARRTLRRRAARAA